MEISAAQQGFQGDGLLRLLVACGDGIRVCAERIRANGQIRRPVEQALLPRAFGGTACFIQARGMRLGLLALTGECLLVEVQQRLSAAPEVRTLEALQRRGDRAPLLVDLPAQSLELRRRLLTELSPKLET